MGSSELKYRRSMRKAYLHSGSSRFIHHQQRIAGILSIRKEAVPEAKRRHPARDVKVVMDENVRRSKLGVETTSLDT